MVQFNIRHTTTYKYDQFITDNKNLIRVYPMETECQHVLSHTISISGNPIITVTKDSFGNKLGMFTMPNPHNELVIISEIDIQNHSCDKKEKARKASKNWDDMSILSSDTAFQLFLNPKEMAPIPEIKSVVDGFMAQNKTPFELAMGLNEYVNKQFTYSPGSTTIESTVLDVWNLKAGVCQDFALLLIYMLRLANLPARYVSGYICPNQDGLKGDGATHAWVDVYIPQFGWLGIDPTNNCCAEEKYVNVAVGRDYQDVAPVKGEFMGQANTTMDVVVTVSYKEVEESVSV
jgi:transglutaminase-like putative cysteine protease